MKSDPGMKVTRRSHYNCTKCPAYCCSVYERVRVLQFERNQQDDDTVVPLVQITFRNGD
jgi:hypothetical protein